jgi:protein ImuA
MRTAEKTRRLHDLKARVAALEAGPVPRRGRFALGCAALDGALGGGLPRAALHEVAAARAEWDDGAATGFAAVLAARLAAGSGGPLLWVCQAADLYGPGLAGCGLDPRRVILAAARSDDEALWAMEAGLRCTGLAGVLGEVANLDLSASRRLQLAAEAGGVTGLLLRRQRGARRLRVEPSAAASRWSVAALPSALEPQPAWQKRPILRDAALRAAPQDDPSRRPFGPPQDEGGVLFQARPHPEERSAGSRLEGWAGARTPAAGFIGRPRWRVGLTRTRGGAPGDWIVEWCHETGDLAVAAPVRHGPAAAADGRRAVPA